MRHARIAALTLAVAGLTWAACRDAVDPGRLRRVAGAPTTAIPPHAEFTWSCVGLTCQFTDLSSDTDGVLVRFDWEFGDSTPFDTLRNPVHTFPAPGSYVVFHAVVDNDSLVDSIRHTVVDTSGGGGGGGGGNIPPVAAFDVHCTLLTCQFTDHSSDSDGVIVTHWWYFGDGGFDTLPNPIHTYGGPGTFNASEVVIDNGGVEDTAFRTVTVDTTGGGGGGNLPPHAAFSVTCSVLTCQFTNQSSDSDGFVAHTWWYFGDGGFDTLPNPIHTYATAGVYPVALVAIDNIGAEDTAFRTVIVPDTSGGGGGDTLTLAASAQRVRGLQQAVLHWSGVPADSFAVYRDSAFRAVVVGGSSYTDFIGARGNGSYVYRVCVLDGVCSNTVKVSFGGSKKK